MRTTVDLPESTHRRLCELATRRRSSLSKVIAELTARGLAQLDEPVTVATDPRSGFPTVSVGRKVTAVEVADLLDDE